MSALTPRQKVEQEPCHCVRCGECNGSGNVWYDIGGRYLGNHHCDDLDSLEPCENCRDGIVEVCDRCQLLTDMDSDDDFDRWLGGTA